MTKKYNKDSPESIQAMFGSIAKNYDRTNAVLSFQMHRYWNRQLVRMMVKNGNPNAVLDLCCGTGEIGLGLMKTGAAPHKLYFLDFCSEMLQCAKYKADKLNLGQTEIAYLHADAQHVPLPNSCIDCATIAYGIRNVQQPAKCLQEVYRVLKPGGVIGILELTQPNNMFLRAGHQFYLRYVLPVIGKLLTSNLEAYQYLCNSIHNFIKPVELEAEMKQSGFTETARTPLLGGVATILSGKKKN